MERATFTIDSEASAFLQQAAGRNRSAYINRLIKEEKRRTLQQRLLTANREEAGDAAYQHELSDWDVTLGDGLPE